MSSTPHNSAGPSGPGGPAEEEQDAGRPVIRDKRRLDPVTGALRQPPAASGSTGQGGPTQAPAGQEAKMADDINTMAEGDDAFGGAVGDAMPGTYQGRHSAAKEPTAAQQAAGAAAYADVQASVPGNPETSAGTPNTGETGVGDSAQPAPSGESSADSHPDTVLAAERLADLQRVQAEYVNYKRRVDRDRELQRDLVISSVMESLVPVLDDIHFAREHGELETGPFAKIAEKLENVLAKYGVERYGQPGDTFDPMVHEAVMHVNAELAPGTTDTTVVQIMQPGYRLGERVIRAALVSVADPQ